MKGQLPLRKARLAACALTVGISLRGVSLSEITHLIRGPAGTKVRLELYEGVDGEKFTVELTRQKLELR